MIEDNIINKEANERTVLVGLVTLKQNEAKVTEYLDEPGFSCPHRRRDSGKEIHPET